MLLCASFYTVNAQENLTEKAVAEIVVSHKPSVVENSEKTERKSKIENAITSEKNFDEPIQTAEKISENELQNDSFKDFRSKSQNGFPTNKRNFFNELKPRYLDSVKPINKEKNIDADDDKNRVDTDVKKWEIAENSVEYGIEGGFAPDIATWMSGPKPWDISGHKHFLASLRWGKILGTRGIVTYSYAIEFVPLSVAIGNQTENKEHRTNPLAPPTKRTNNFGAAINPTSFRFIFFPQYRLRPFIFSGLGISYHLKPVPVESGTKWNLAWDFGFGGQYMLSKTKAIQFGYRYYHLSNVYLSNYNPGYNSNVYFVGYSIFKK